jgi:hypothetical protein
MLCDALFISLLCGPLFIDRLLTGGFSRTMRPMGPMLFHAAPELAWILPARHLLGSFCARSLIAVSTIILPAARAPAFFALSAVCTFPALNSFSALRTFRSFPALRAFRSFPALRLHPSLTALLSFSALDPVTTFPFFDALTP